MGGVESCRDVTVKQAKLTFPTALPQMALPDLPDLHDCKDDNGDGLWRSRQRSRHVTPVVGVSVFSTTPFRVEGSCAEMSREQAETSTRPPSETPTEAS